MPVILKVLEITGWGGVITVSDSVLVSVPLALTTDIATGKVPLNLGIPEINPVPVFKFRLSGKPAAMKLVGNSLPVIW